MATTRKNPSKKTTRGWNEFKQDLAHCIISGNNILIAHGDIIKKNGNPAKKPQSVDPALSLLKDLYRLKIELESHQHIEVAHTQQKTDLTDNEKTKLKVSEMDLVDAKKMMASLIIQVSKITADKYMFLKEGTSNTTKKRKYASAANDLIQKAWDLHGQTTGTLLPKDYDPALEGLVAHIQEEYEMLHANITGKDPIQDLLIIAHNMAVKENAYAKFQEAFELAKQAGNEELQFKISYEQARSYIEILFESKNKFLDIKEIKHRQAVIRMVSNAFINAIKIKLAYNKHNAGMKLNSEGICIDLLRLAKNLLVMSTNETITNDFELRLNLLKDAQEYQEFGAKLSKNINKHIGDFDELSKDIENERQHAESEKVFVENEKVEAEKKNRLLAQLNQEYDVNQEIRKFYTEDELRKLENPQEDEKNNLESGAQQNNASTPEEDDNDPIDAPEEEELTPIYITFEYKREKRSQINLIDLTENINALVVAESKNDLLEQLRIHFNIAEYYRIQSMHSLRKNIYSVPHAIEQLEETKNHLQVASTLVEALKSQPNAAKIPLEDWVITLLEDIENLLAKTLKRQSNIKERFDRSHDDAMNYIISKYGPEGWFKHDKFDWSNLSDNAKIRSITNSNVNRLTEIHEEVSQIHDQFKSIAQTNQNDEHIKLAYKQQNFFYHSNKPKPPLRRSQSLNSFFDEDEMNARTMKRLGFGR